MSGCHRGCTSGGQWREVVGPKQILNRCASVRIGSAISRRTNVPSILVVDDEPMVCEFVAAALRHKGFSVLTAANGEEAIAVSSRHSGDILLIITDVKMPIMDGPALIRFLSAGTPDIPVLFMSAYCNRG